MHLLTECVSQCQSCGRSYSGLSGINDALHSNPCLRLGGPTAQAMAHWIAISRLKEPLQPHWVSQSFTLDRRYQHVPQLFVHGTTRIPPALLRPERPQAPSAAACPATHGGADPFGIYSLSAGRPSCYSHFCLAFCLALCLLPAFFLSFFLFCLLFPREEAIHLQTVGTGRRACQLRRCEEQTYEIVLEYIIRCIYPSAN